MDYSTYLKNKMKASDNYKSNWQGRDASEVTTRRRDIATASIATIHQGPDGSCTPCTIPIRSSTNIPTSGFSTDYTSDYSVGIKKAGCVQCSDPNWGVGGGVTTKSQADINILLAVPFNPVKSTGGGVASNANYMSSIISVPCSIADPGVKFHQIYDPKQSMLFPSG